MELKIFIQKRKVKNLNLRVKIDGSVTLSVPLSLSDSYIQDFLVRKKRWIYKTLQRLQSREEYIESYKVGSNILYLGERYRINITKSNLTKVVLLEKELMIYTDRVDEKNIKDIIYNWYKEKATLLFKSYVDSWSNKMNLEYSSLTIRKMSTRWGSCRNYKKVITLNLELIKKPIECIEYVVVHELAHILYPHHQKEFWSYVESYLPEWKKLKERLKKDE